MQFNRRFALLLCVSALAVAACDDESGGPSGPDDEGNPPAEGCSDGMLASGALYRTCFPATWNGELVIYAHGYVRGDAPLSVPKDLLGGVPVSSVVTSIGYAFTTTSYRANGLVADVAVDDLIDLDEQFRRSVRPDPSVTYVVGASEGGLVAALAAERDTERFSGALAACGPVGDFTRQIDYIGDFRVMFDYFFPDLLPGSAVEVPDELRGSYESQYVPQIQAAVASNPNAARQLVAVTGVAMDQAAPPATLAETITDVLWYNVHGTRDARARLGGQPYENSDRLYQGSDDDDALNAGVARHAADPAAREAIGRLDTSGDITVPVVTLHTTGDPIVPFFHEALYGAKVSAAGLDPLLTQQTAERHGHCSFTQIEVQTAFGTLIQRVSAAARAPQP